MGDGIIENEITGKDGRLIAKISGPEPAREKRLVDNKYPILDMNGNIIGEVEDLDFPPDVPLYLNR